MVSTATGHMGAAVRGPQHPKLLKIAVNTDMLSQMHNFEQDCIYIIFGTWGGVTFPSLLVWPEKRNYCG